MRPAFQEHHFDYVQGPPQTSLLASWAGNKELATVAAGQQLIGIPLQLQPDASFLLRSIAVRMTYPVLLKSCVKRQNLQFLKFRFTGPDSNYLMDRCVPFTIWSSFFGQLGNPQPVWPGLLYPPNATLLLDLQNTGTTDITNLTIYYRGVKLFKWGQRPYYPYPNRFSAEAYTYPINVSSLAVTETRLNQVFTAKQDADFVWRSGQAGISTASNNFFEVFFTWKDGDYYPHSSQPVHADVLFGQRQDTGSVGIEYPCGAAFIPSVEAGPANPGLWYPEFYIPKQRQLFYDVIRNDAAYTGCASSADYPLLLHGSKVYPLPEAA